MINLTKTGKLSSKSKGVLEYAMMSGNTVQCNNEALEQVLEYCLPALIPKYNAPQTGDTKTEMKKYIKNVLNTIGDKELVALCFNRVYQMPCITFVLNDEEEPEPCTYESLGKGVYAFCYVLNLESDWCSEFGGCYFENFRRLS